MDEQREHGAAKIKEANNEEDYVWITKWFLTIQ